MEPGFPWKIAMETARKWLNKMGIVVLTAKKGSYVDGREHYDVVDYRKEFLRRMVALRFLNAPTESAKARFISRPSIFPTSSHLSLSFVMSPLSIATRIRQSSEEANLIKLLRSISMSVQKMPIMLDQDSVCPLAVILS